MKKYVTLQNRHVNYILLIVLFVCTQVVSAQVTGLSNVDIFLDPGHAQEENMGLYNYSEAEKVLQVALELKEMLETQTDINNVYMCRLTDSDQISLSERTDLANSLGVDFYYSIHSDAGSPGSNSTLTMYGGYNLEGITLEKTPNGGKAFGDILADDLTGVMRISSRGNYADRVYYLGNEYTHTNQWPYLHVNRTTNMASLLSEGGFHTNPTQQQLNVNAEWKRMEALSAFRSFLEFYGIDRPSIGIAAGIITDANTGIPINGVTVSIGDKTYTTDTYETLFYKYTGDEELMHNGFYWIEGLTPGQDVEVVFSSDSYMTKSVLLNVGSNPNGRTLENINFLDVELINNVPAVVTGIEVEGTVDDVMPGASIIVTFSREMNRTTVENAVSTSPAASLSFTWKDDFTLEISTNELSYSTAYTFTVDGSIAKNIESDQFLDGDNDGNEGGNYQFIITTSDPDTEAPVLVEKWPSANEPSEVIRPVLRLVFNEQILESGLSESSVTLRSNNEGTSISSTITHSLIGDQSVVHLFPNEDLINNQTYNVEIMGLEDIYGNVIEPIIFSFMVLEMPITETTYIDRFDSGITGWSQPTSSLSTVGVVRSETNCIYEEEIACHMSDVNSGSMKLNYWWSEGASNPYIRELLSSSSVQNTNRFNTEHVLQMYVFGDGSNNKFRFVLKDGNFQTEASQWYTLDWKGWKLLSWDLNEDPVIAWSSGNGVLDGSGFYIDGIHMTSGEGSDVHGSLYFDDLRYVVRQKYQPTSILEYQDTKIKVFPNPVKDVLNIDTEESMQKIELFNLSGQVVLSKLFSQGERSIDLRSLIPGMYLIKIETDSGIVVSKIQKIK